MITASVITDGSLLLAIPIAVAAGFVSFLSPCVLPLVPGYLSYLTGLTGAELGIAAAQPTRSGVESGQSAGTVTGRADGGVAVRQPVATDPQGISTVVKSSRVLLGTLGFIAGFTAIFVSYGALFGALGGLLLEYQQLIAQVMGLVVIALGLAFMGWLPGFQREYRLHRSPTFGLWGAPALGALFGLGWTPCIGPTLAAVQTLAFTEGSALRGAVLSLAYCLGLGVPFILLGLGFRKLAGTVGWVRRHSLLVMRIGGGLLIVIGLLLVTGLWSDLTIAMRTWVGSFEVAL